MAWHIIFSHKKVHWKLKSENAFFFSSVYDNDLGRPSPELLTMTSNAKWSNMTLTADFVAISKNFSEVMDLLLTPTCSTKPSYRFLQNEFINLYTLQVICASLRILMQSIIVHLGQSFWYDLSFMPDTSVSCAALVHQGIEDQSVLSNYVCFSQ